MEKKLFWIFLLQSLFTLTILAQQKNKSSIVFLENDNIADINISQEKFIARIKEVIDIFDKEFATVLSTQKIALYINLHQKGLPTIELYSMPKIATSQATDFLNKIKQINFDPTKLVDFPFLLTLNTTSQKPEEEFPEFESPKNKRIKAYQNADWQKKIILNKSYALENVLPVLSTYASNVDPKFEGVKKFGIKVINTDFNQMHNISIFTSNNPDYWRATTEMGVGNQLIPITKIFLHISQGEMDYAFKDIPIVRFFSDEKNISDNYLEEINWRVGLFRKDIEIEINKGIKEHDKGNFEKAITIYKDIINVYPNSAWARYELYYSQNALDLKNNKDQKIEDSKLWDNSKEMIFRCNPLYSISVRASNGKEGYLMFRRQEINSLFKNKDTKLQDIFTYAKIAMDLDAYDFAAQLCWFYTTYSKENETGLKYFLYALEKLGIKDFKNNFKYDFVKEFKSIDDVREKEMKDNAMYQAFKNN